MNDQIQLWTLVVQAIATVVIAFFACATWRATQTYARLTAFSLFENAAKGGGEKAPESFYSTLSAILKRTLPRDWEKLRKHLPNIQE
jgi:hypothetical protein